MLRMQQLMTRPNNSPPTTIAVLIALLDGGGGVPGWPAAASGWGVIASCPASHHWNSPGDQNSPGRIITAWVRSGQMTTGKMPWARQFPGKCEGWTRKVAK